HPPGATKSSSVPELPALPCKAYSMRIALAGSGLKRARKASPSAGSSRPTSRGLASAPTSSAPASLGCASLGGASLSDPASRDPHANSEAAKARRERQRGAADGTLSSLLAGSRAASSFDADG